MRHELLAVRLHFSMTSLYYPHSMTFSPSLSQVRTKGCSLLSGGAGSRFMRARPRVVDMRHMSSWILVRRESRSPSHRLRMKRQRTSSCFHGYRISELSIENGIQERGCSTYRCLGDEGQGGNDVSGRDPALSQRVEEGEVLVRDVGLEREHPRVLWTSQQSDSSPVPRVCNARGT